MAGVSPLEAESNLKAWLDVFGIEGIGDAWTHATDVQATWVGGGVLVVCSIILLSSYVPVIGRRLTAWGTRGESNSSSMAMYPTPTTWIARPEPLAILGASSLVRLRVPSETITVLEALLRHAGQSHTKTPGEIRAEELVRKLLRDFEDQNPNGVRDEQYGKELLEWWIEEQAFRTDA